MSAAVPLTPVLGEDEVARVMAVPTRAGIYRRLRAEARPASAREVAALFGIHTNVARTHLDRLAAAGLVVTSLRRNPLGGRPAKVYVAREQAHAPGGDVTIPPGAQLGVHVIVQLIAGLGEHTDRLALLAEEQGRRLVAASAGRADRRDLAAAAAVAGEALRPAFPEVRLTLDGDTLLVDGLEVSLRLIGEVDGAVGDALAVGFLRGALAAAGAPAIVTSQAGRVRAALDTGGGGTLPSPDASVDARGLVDDRGVLDAMRAMTGLRAGGHLEVLTDLEGAPATYARWADRAGHQVLDVTRVRDVKGRRAVRILLRKATGR